jgi:hypothetical protein
MALVVAAAAVDLMGFGLLLTASLFKEDISALGALRLFVSGPVLFVLSVGLDAGMMVEVAAEADVPEREVRLAVIILVLAVDEATDGVGLIAMGLEMGTAFGATVVPSVCVVFVTARAFKDILLGMVERVLGASDRFCTVTVSWKGSSLAKSRR